MFCQSQAKACGTISQSSMRAQVEEQDTLVDVLDKLPGADLCSACYLAMCEVNSSGCAARTECMIGLSFIKPCLMRVPGARYSSLMRLHDATRHSIDGAAAAVHAVSADHMHACTSTNCTQPM